MKKLISSFIVMAATFSVATVFMACSDDSSTDVGGTIEDTNPVGFTDSEIAIIDSIVAANMVSPNSSNSASADIVDLDSAVVPDSPVVGPSRSKIDEAYLWEDRENVYEFHNSGNVNYCAVFASEKQQGLFQTQSERGGGGYVIFEMTETEFGTLAMEYMHYSHWDLDCDAENEILAKACDALGGYYKLGEKGCQNGSLDAACTYKVTDKKNAQKNFQEKGIASCKDFESTHPEEIIPTVYCEGSTEGGMKCDTTYSDPIK